MEVKYFRHSVEERSNECVKNIILQHGAKGYGIYWYILENLYSSAGNEIKLGREFYKKASIELQTRTWSVKKVLNLMIVFDLLTDNSGYVKSKRVEREVIAITEANKRRRKNGSMRTNT